MPLGSFPGSSYDEVSFDLAPGDLFVFCTDGVFEASDAQGESSAPTGCWTVVEQTRDQARRARSSTRSSPPFTEFRGETPPNDDMTAVAVRITTRERIDRYYVSSLSDSSRRCRPSAWPPSTATSFDPALDADVRAARRRPRVLRQHRHLAGSIVHLVEPGTARAGCPTTLVTTPSMLTVRSLVAARVALEVGDAGELKRSAQAHDDRRAASDDARARDVVRARDAWACPPDRNEPRRIVEVSDGIRRCQRLPEVTYPVDPTRPRRSVSNRVPAPHVRIACEMLEATPRAS